MTIDPKPRRQLGLFDATMIVMGGIIGAGIFANPSEVAHRVHTPFLILGVWVLGGLLAMCGAFIWAELGTRLRETNSVLIVPGDHFGMDGYLRINYGGPREHLEEGLRRLEDVYLRSARHTPNSAGA